MKTYTIKPLEWSGKKPRIARVWWWEGGYSASVPFGIYTVDRTADGFRWKFRSREYCCEVTELCNSIEDGKAKCEEH